MILLFLALGSLEARKFTIVPEITSRQIKLKDYSEAFNPSLVKWKEGYLLSFRYLPDLARLWVSRVGLVELDENFNPVGPAQILNLRADGGEIPCQAEDARLFSHGGQLYIVYNDNRNQVNPSNLERRDMFLAQVVYDGRFHAKGIQKLTHATEYKKAFWQKNWSPFFFEDQLYLSYTINPHEVVTVGQKGKCEPLHRTAFQADWSWGTWRGGTPAELVDGEYLAFFHSSRPMVSEATPQFEKWHYFMGAYTFSREPPFELTSYTPYPIIGEGFYERSKQPKRVIFPGGFVVDGEKIHIAYGKNDNEVWISTIEKSKLKELLVPISKGAQ